MLRSYHCGTPGWASDASILRVTSIGRPPNTSSRPSRRSGSSPRSPTSGPLTPPCRAARDASPTMPKPSPGPKPMTVATGCACAPRSQNCRPIRQPFEARHGCSGRIRRSRQTAAASGPGRLTLPSILLFAIRSCAMATPWAARSNREFQVEHWQAGTARLSGHRQLHEPHRRPLGVFGAPSTRKDVLCSPATVSCFATARG